MHLNSPIYFAWEGGGRQLLKLWSKLDLIQITLVRKPQGLDFNSSATACGSAEEMKIICNVECQKGWEDTSLPSARRGRSGKEEGHERGEMKGQESTIYFKLYLPPFRISSITSAKTHLWHKNMYLIKVAGSSPNRTVSFLRRQTHAESWE